MIETAPVILLLDNYDSFVHNLARYFRRLGCQTKVVRSDQIDAAGCQRLRPDGIVISPGPRGPEQAGCSVDVIQRVDSRIPILGVCLGHQSIGHAWGARIVMSGPRHGMASEIEHDGEGLFRGCPSPMMVGRYHSLVIEPQSLPTELIVTARTQDGVIMAVRHRDRPVMGVQFHPESVLTDHGLTLLENFVTLSGAAQRELIT